jgi:membrane protein DedA with SNARE-associated domain
MQEVLNFVARHGGPVVFVVLFLDQLGLPLPSVPVLLALGALAGMGRIDPVAAFGAAVAGSLLADWVWFALGRRYGTRALGLLCRISLEPDTCVAKTRGMFTRHGVPSLSFAKFVPGYDTVAPALAGLLGVGTGRFLAWSLLGAVVWIGAFGAIGYALGDRAEKALATASSWGDTLGIALAAGLALYVGWKWLQRRRVLVALRMARITPQELHARIAGGESVEIIDVRHDEALESAPYAIPGARFLSMDELEARHGEIPRERDVVVYCT